MNEVSSAGEYATPYVALPTESAKASRPTAAHDRNGAGRAKTVAETIHPYLTKPRQASIAVVTRQVQRYETYWPMLETWVRRAGRWCKKRSAMLPRHALARPSDATHSLGPVRSTPGATNLVRFGPVLACVASDKLAGLQALLADRAARQQLQKPL